MSAGEEGNPVAPSSVAGEDLAEEAPVGVFVVQEGRVVYANRWLGEFGGYAPGRFPPDLSAVVHPDDLALLDRQIRLRLAGQDTAPSCAVRFIRSDGGVREAEVYDRKVAFAGRPAILATLIDITARVAAERALQGLTARLEESNRLRRIFSDILSHDLMNPVWIAENYLRLAMDGGVPEDRRPFYEGMRGAITRAREILADTRTYLKLQDLAAPEGEAADLGQLAEAVAQSLRPLAAAKGQRITVEVAGGPALVASPLAREVVWQLLSNAIKYGPADSEAAVSVSAGRSVVLRVSDRGPGVPEADRELVFQRFQGLGKGPVSGVGLGLAIVHRVVELHGGRVWVEDHPGGGGVFAAEFPAAP